VQSYSITVESDARVFALSDFDVTGKETLHGPFQLGQEYGVIAQRQAIDWQAEQDARDAKAQKRAAQRKLQQVHRNLQRKLRRASMDNNKQESSMINSFISQGLAVVLSVVVPTAHAEELVNLTTTESGIHQVSVQTLQDNGIDIVGESASEVALMNRGERVPIQVTGSDPLDVDSNIRFIADALDTLAG